MIMTLFERCVADTILSIWLGGDHRVHARSRRIGDDACHFSFTSLWYGSSVNVEISGRIHEDT